MDEPKITSDMTIKEAYEIMIKHYPENEYYIDMDEKSLYIGTDDLIKVLELRDKELEE